MAASPYRTFQIWSLNNTWKTNYVLRQMFVFRSKDSISLKAFKSHSLWGGPSLKSHINLTLLQQGTYLINRLVYFPLFKANNYDLSESKKMTTYLKFNLSQNIYHSSTNLPLKQWWANLIQKVSFPDLLSAN